MSTLVVLLLLAQFGEGEPNCKDPQTQTEMNHCAAKEFQSADAELNAQWRITLQRVRRDDSPDVASDGRPTGEATLRDAQRTWIRFRDAHCTLVGYAARGGTMEPLLFDACRAELTRERTGQLKHLVNEP